MGITIEKLEFANFRQYGTGVIRFDTFNDYKLSVLVAKNGTGKTTLLNSITWCLYEKEEQLNDKKSSLPVVGIYSLEQAELNSVIPVSVAVTIHDGEKIIEFKREQTFKKILDHNGVIQGIAGPISFTVATTKNGQFENTNNVEGPDADIIVKKYFDPAIFDFYFFDGEKLKEFFASSRTGHIQSSIYNIAQVTLLQNAYEHVGKMRTEKMRALGKKNPEVSELNQKQEDIVQKIDLAQKTIEINSTEKEKFLAERVRLDEILRTYSPINNLQDERLKLEQELKRYDREKKKLSSDRAEMIRKYIVLIKLYPRMKRSLDLIKEKEENGDLPPTVDRNQIKKVLAHLEEPCPLCGSKIDERGRIYLENMLNKISVSSKTSNYLKEIKGTLERYLEEVQNYPEVRDEIRQREIDLESRIKKIENRLKEINSTLMNYSNSTGTINVSAIEKERDQVMKDISLADRSIGSSSANIREYELKLKALQKKIKEETAKLNEKNVLKQETHILVAIEDSFKKIKDSITNKMRSEIETITWNIFDSMIWKHNTFGKITISDKYDVSVYNKEGNIMTGSLSATEQMALAYAFTLAIHYASGKNCPLVIDSPLGRVSDENRENMAKALLEISKEKQIIMLFTPDEFSDSVKQIYNGKVDIRQLQLSNNEKYVEGIEK